MLSITSISYLIFIFTIIIMNLAYFISKKSLNEREKNSPFECGFDPLNSSRLPFSLRFFLITIIFLIFDVEIVLIFPIIITFNYSNLIIWTITSFIFLLILIVGLLHEWKQGALNW